MNKHLQDNKVYFVNIGVFLPKSKQYFDDRSAAIDFINKMIKKALTLELYLEDIITSIKLLEIDTKKLPNYKDFYKEKNY